MTKTMQIICIYAIKVVNLRQFLNNMQTETEYER